MRSVSTSSSGGGVTSLFFTIFIRNGNFFDLNICTMMKIFICWRAWITLTKDTFVSFAYQDIYLANILCRIKFTLANSIMVLKASSPIDVLKRGLLNSYYYTYTYIYVCIYIKRVFNNYFFLSLYLSLSLVFSLARVCIFLSLFFPVCPTDSSLIAYILGALFSKYIEITLQTSSRTFLTI